jgi:hypothetical protein
MGQMPALFGTTFGEETNDTTESTESTSNKTTPAGIYQLGYKGITEEVRELYDNKIIRIYGENMDLAIHGIYKAEYEERKARLDTPTPHDNFMSWGCINVEEFDKYFGNFGERDLLGVLPEDPNKTVDPQTGNVIGYERA